ncbi:MAG: helix-turn-helix transcriptional regulator [Clostridia bacterium]|nr:helix-turn-helix transcriptional regulator [Clostridia bacterium]
MITFYRLWDRLNRSGKKQKDLKEILSPATINKLRKNEIVTTDTLNKLCVFLECQPEDILEFEPDQEGNS